MVLDFKFVCLFLSFRFLGLLKKNEKLKSDYNQTLGQRCKRDSFIC